jgi:polyhydroxyalkanoate synthesis regulator phasin
MEYKIITATSCDQLAKRVNKTVVDGWVPLGGIALDAGHDAYQDFIAQAMVRTGLWLEQGHKLGSFEVEKIESTPEPEPVPSG